MCKTLTKEAKHKGYTNIRQGDITTLERWQRKSPKKNQGQGEA